nr:MAG TPA: Insecticide toxin TcdB middle/N-terminal region [Caudoviricetes sp.]
MLQALQTLAEIGDVDLGLKFSVDINGDGVNDFKTLNEII